MINQLTLFLHISIIELPGGTFDWQMKGCALLQGASIQFPFVM